MKIYAHLFDTDGGHWKLFQVETMDEAIQFALHEIRRTEHLIGRDDLFVELAVPGVDHDELPRHYFNKSETKQHEYTN